MLLRGMFMRGMKEAEERIAKIYEPWDPASFGSFIKSLFVSFFFVV